MKVVFFHRKPRPNLNFSVENLYRQIRLWLPQEVHWEVKELRYFSNGFFKRLAISLEAAFNQGDINHVTGDINFISIFLKKRKTVLTMLDVGLMNRPPSLTRLLLQWFWIILPVKRSAAVITISESTKKELLHYVRVDPAKIKVVYVPISSLFHSVPKKFNKLRPRILQIGTRPNKNVPMLVRALKGINCELDIVGIIDDTLRKEIEDAGITVYTSKNISEEEIVEKYKAADVVAFVSTYEGFGMPIVEGNTVGRVVVTSNILSMPEVGGDAAHYVDPGDVESIREGIRRVIEDDQYRETLIEKGYKNAQRFEASEIARQHVAIYKSLMDRA